MAPRANGPVSSGSPSARASAADGPVRLGPATAPMVVAQTTIESARPRCSGSARSVAAYLAPLLAAVVEPSISAPSSSSGIEEIAPATTASTAPPAPTR